MSWPLVVVLGGGEGGIVFNEKMAGPVFRLLIFPKR